MAFASGSARQGFRADIAQPDKLRHRSRESNSCGSFVHGEKPMLTPEKLYPLYVPTNHRCHTCQLLKVASAIQIVAKRQRYFCHNLCHGKWIKSSLDSIFLPSDLNRWVFYWAEGVVKIKIGQSKYKEKGKRTFYEENLNIPQQLRK